MPQRADEDLPPEIEQFARAIGELLAADFLRREREAREADLDEATRRNQ